MADLDFFFFFAFEDLDEDGGAGMGSVGANWLSAMSNAPGTVCILVMTLAGAQGDSGPTT